MTCIDCDPISGPGLWHCHELSIEHADGTTQCLGDERCDLPHELHHWQVPCTEVDPRCGCQTVEVEPGVPFLLAA